MRYADVSERGRLRADFAGFMVGLASIWIQVVLIRRLLSTFSGNELTIGIVLSSWMVWTGLGTILPARYSDRVRSPALALGVVFLIVSLLIVPSVLATARIKVWLGVSMGEVAGLPYLVAASFIITAPVCAALGFSFNLAARMQGDYKVAAGRAYRFEALGAFVAGVVLAFVFSRKTSPLFPALAMAFILAAAAPVISGLKDKGPRRLFYGSVAVVVLGLVCLGGVFLSGGSIRKLYGQIYWQGYEVLDSFDSRYGYLAAIREGDEVTVFEDGSPAATFPAPATDELLVHLPLAMCASPRRVLIIGNGFSGMAVQVLKHRVERVDYVQLDPGWIELERRFAPDFRSIESDPRAGIHRDDARAWLRKNEGAYDVVIVNLPDPFTAGLNRFYTAEFFDEVKTALAPGGVLAFTAGTTPPNLAYTPGQIGLLAGVMATVESVFVRSYILPLDLHMIVAGDESSGLTQDPDRIDKVLAGRGIESFYASKNMLGASLVPGLLKEIEDKVGRAPTSIDRDLHPRGYLYGIMLWAERTTPGVKKAVRAITALPSWSLGVLPILVLVLGWIWRRKSGVVAEAALAAGASGFAGIVVEVAAMISYQMLEGSVYFALTVLTAAFMIGLTGGAWLWERARERMSLRWMEAFLVVWIGVGILAVWALTGAHVRGVVAMLGFCGVLFGQGLVSGALFPAAAAMVIGGGNEVGRGIGRVNGAEHLGAALGGVLAGAVLVPVFGIMGAMASALLVALAVLMVSAFRG